jgi:hypothetical protein
MKRSISLFAVTGLASLLSCSDGTDPKGANCPAETGSVQVTVTSGANPVFDWQPRCAVALLLIEEEASDQWVISGEDLSSTTTESANRILPPITYGQVPSGIFEESPPETLVAGRTYEVILWKIVPAGSTVQCQQRFENACLLAVHPFQR